MADFLMATICAFLSGCFIAVPIGISINHGINSLIGVPIALVMIIGVVLTAWKFFAP